MADPVSLAASVAGLVSLGIQVTSGVRKYLDAVDCRDEELSSARGQNDILKNIITTIERTSSKLEHTFPDSAAAAKQSTEACKDSLHALESLVAELTSSDVSTWRSRLKDKAGKLHYAFDRSEVQQLTSRVSQTNSTLQLAVDGLGLSAIVATLDSVADIQSQVPGLESGIHLVQHQLDGQHKASTQRMVDSTRELSDQIGQVQEMSHSSFNLQHGYLERIQEQNSNLADKLSGIETSLQAFVFANCADNGLPDDGTHLERTVARLAAKPAAFREFCEIIPSQSTLEVTARDAKYTQLPWHASVQSNSRPNSIKTSFPKFTSPCTCGRRIKLNRKHSKFGSLYLYRELSSESHSPYCPMSETVPPTQKWRYGLRFVGLAQAIKAGIEATFDMTFGAGGWSISPGFRYYPTVDAEKDPAFRIFNILRQSDRLMLKRMNGRDQNLDEHLIAFYQVAIRKIAKLFISGKTSPFVVDSSNQSLMHAAFDAFSLILMEDRRIHLLDEFVRILLRHGVPPISYNVRGYAAGVAFGGDKYWKIPAKHMKSVALIAEAEGGMMPMSVNPVSQLNPISKLDYTKYFENSIPFALALGCGPLGMVVLQGDGHRAQSFLENHPNAIEERDMLGYTPLHMAVLKNTLPHFGSVLKAAKAANLLQQQDAGDNNILLMALKTAGYNCRNSGGPMECTDCSCSDSLAMLLEAGAVLGKYDLRLLRNIPESPTRRWRVLFSHLKAQREKLKEIALRNIWAVRESLGLIHNNQVLDLHASRISRTLQKHHIDVPVDLVLTEQSNDNKERYPTVYNFIPPKVQLAELLFQMGFQDVDFDAQYGRPPLTESYPLEMIEWLIRKGANLQRRIWPLGDEQSSTRGIFSAHRVMHWLGCMALPMWGQRTEVTKDIEALITARILPVRLTDCCLCACSVEGCTPFVYMLKLLPPRFMPNQPRDIARMDFTNISRGIPPDIIGSLYLTAVRFACFESLGLTHTCCNALDVVVCREPYVVTNDHEAEEIQEEESALLEVLDSMLVEYVERTANTPDDPVQLQAHWKDYWVNYVPGILRKLRHRQMTKEERRDAEMIGVVWKDDDSDQTSDDDSDYDAKADRKHTRKLDEYYRSLDECHRSLDSIMEDI